MLRLRLAGRSEASPECGGPGLPPGGAAPGELRRVLCEHDVECDVTEAPGTERRMPEFYCFVARELIVTVQYPRTHLWRNFLSHSVGASVFSAHRSNTTSGEASPEAADGVCEQDRV